MECHRANGFAIIELMVSVAILSVILMGTLSFNDLSLTEQFRSNLKWQAASMRSNIQDLLNSEAAWSNTLIDPNNTSLACLSDPSTCVSGQGGNIYVVRDLNNSQFYDWLGSDGLTTQGVPCTGFSAVQGAGNDSCPMQFQISWVADCAQPLGVACGTSEVLPKVTIQALSNPATFKTPFNGTQYGATFYQGSTSSVCTWNFNGSLFDMCGNVGIGTTSPVGRVDIVAPDSLAGPWAELYLRAPNSALRFISTINGSDGGQPANYIESGLDATTGSSADLLFTDMHATRQFMTIKATSGNVGIGTTSPISPLQVNFTNSVAANDVLVELFNPGQATAHYPTLNHESYMGPSGTGWPIEQFFQSRGSAAAAQPVMTGDTLGALNFWGRTTAPSYNYSWGAGISVVAGENYSATNGGTSLVFQTTRLGQTSNGLNPPPTSMIIDPNGHIGIGTSNPTYPLDVVGDIRTSGCLVYASSTLGSCSSDERLKKDIKPYNLGLKEIIGINPVTFKYNGLGGIPDDGKTQLGVIAQQVEKVAPQLVGTKELKLHADDKTVTITKTVDYGAFTYMIINAIKSLYDQASRLAAHQATEDQTLTSLNTDIEKIKAENAELKNDNIDLKRQNAQIKAWVCSKDPSVAFCH